MTVVKVQCSPEDARLLAKHAKSYGLFEISAALTILADDVEQLRAALIEAAETLEHAEKWAPQHPSYLDEAGRQARAVLGDGER